MNPAPDANGITRETDHESHGPGHAGCPTCEAAGGPRLTTPRGLSTVKVSARGEDFRIVQIQGQLFVCTRQNGSCCCGWAEKGRLAFDPATLWGMEWERRKIRNRVHLTFTGCLGPCPAGNNALLQIHGRSVWLKDLNDPTLVPLVFEYIQAMLDAGLVLPPTGLLRDHVYERYVAPPGDEWRPLQEGGAEEGGGLERLDPVCLMDVDPATARFKVEHGARVVAFCGPSCKRQFLADPLVYLPA